MEDRLRDIFDHKVVSSTEFRGVQSVLGMLDPKLVIVADWKTREGTIELHKGLHWINLELAEFLGASSSEQFEELADVLHFLVEFCILCGIDHTVIDEEKDLDRLDVVFNASLGDPFVFEDAHTNARFTMHSVLHVAELLKNKPWKQTLKLERNEKDFIRRVKGMWYWYGATCRTAGMTPQNLYDEFVRKEEINHNRVATGV
jgi:hypothetical protein